MITSAWRKEFDALLDLKSGWNGYDAKPISLVALAVAKQLLSIPLRVAPLPHGGVRLYWVLHREEFSIDITPDGHQQKGIDREGLLTNV